MCNLKFNQNPTIPGFSHFFLSNSSFVFLAYYLLLASHGNALPAQSASLHLTGEQAFRVEQQAAPGLALRIGSVSVRKLPKKHLPKPSLPKTAPASNPKNKAFAV
jgi:hypothetical protein